MNLFTKHTQKVLFINVEHDIIHIQFFRAKIMSFIDKLISHVINALVCCALAIALSGASYASTHDDINLGLTCSYDVFEVFDTSEKESLSNNSPLNNIDSLHNLPGCEFRLNNGYKNSLIVVSWFDALLTALIAGFTICEILSLYRIRQKKISFLVPLWRFRCQLLQNKFSQYQ